MNRGLAALGLAALVAGMGGSASAERMVTLTPRFRVGRSTPSITTIYFDKAKVSRGLPDKMGQRSPWWSPLRSSGGQDLLRELLHSHGAERDVPIATLPSLLQPGRRYTVVVTDNALSFAPVGKNLVSRLISKHFVLADGEPERVRYAGEMWLEDGHLVLDDSSGTFRPTVEELEEATAFFRDVLGIRGVVARATIGGGLGQSSTRSTQRRAER